MTAWAQLLHFYQPPTQTHDVLRRVVNESYRPLLRVLLTHPNTRVAVNMNAVLSEMLVEHGYSDVIESLRELVDSGRAELVGSGRFHPILPLIPAAERERSIRENAEVNERIFGKTWRPSGFFPPEMCWSQEVAGAIARQGHRWVALSGIACGAEWPVGTIYRMRAGRASLAVLFRDDVRSDRISFRRTSATEFIEDLAEWGDETRYVFTAMDAETFGHHLKHWEDEFLGEVLGALGRGRGAASGVTMLLPSDVTQRYPQAGFIEPRPSSWSTSEQDIDESNPYPLWKAPGNDLHALQWDYVHHCVDLLAVAHHHAHGKDARKYAAMAEEQLQPALHSCQFWWASRRPMWDPSMIHRGFLLLSAALLYAAKSIATSSAPAEVKQQTEWRIAAANDIRWLLERELMKADPV
jgi:alpha-amylase/alpha-mannosidase (GH57 family)